MTQPSLVWLYPGRLDHELDAATWLTTTAELRMLGWQVTMVAAGPAGRRMVGGTEINCVPMTDLYFLRQFIFHAGFYWLLLKEKLKPDVIMFGQMTAPWMLPLRLMRILRSRKRPLLVIDIRTLHMDAPNKQGLKGRLRGWFQDLNGRYASRWVDGYLAITRRMAESMNIIQDELWGTWPSGVDLELFKPAQTRHSWPGGNSPVRLIYIGALHYERNLMNLCLAVEQANLEGLAFELWLVGSGNEGPALQEFAAHTNDRIRVLSSIAHAEVPAVLAQAHIGVLPFTDEIKFQVSSPIKLFEYMAAGLPLLATQLYCHTDVVGNDDYVFWAQNASVAGLLDALRLAWSRRADLPQMGSLAASAAPEWTWHKSAQKLKKALETGLERNPE